MGTRSNISDDRTYSLSTQVIKSVGVRAFAGVFVRAFARVRACVRESSCVRSREFVRAFAGVFVRALVADCPLCL